MVRFKELREAAGLTQQGVAERIGVTQQAVDQWEHGVFMPRADKLTELAEILGCEVVELLT